MTALADQIHDRPVPLPLLDYIQFQSDQFRPAKATAKEHREHGEIALGTHTIAIGTLQDL